MRHATWRRGGHRPRVSIMAPLWRVLSHGPGGGRQVAGRRRAAGRLSLAVARAARLAALLARHEHRAILPEVKIELLLVEIGIESATQPTRGHARLRGHAAQRACGSERMRGSEGMR